AHEWGRLCGLRDARLFSFTAAVVLLFVVLFVSAPGGRLAAFAVAAAFWLVVAPLWLARGFAGASTVARLGAGFVVLVPASLAMTALEPARLLAVLVLV